jgi:hypothetical protein
VPGREGARIQYNCIMRFAVGSFGTLSHGEVSTYDHFPGHAPIAEVYRRGRVLDRVLLTGAIEHQSMGCLHYRLIRASWWRSPWICASPNRRSPGC